MYSWLIVVLPLWGLIMVVLNLLTWPRGHNQISNIQNLSLLIPVRNEAARIEATIHAAFESKMPLLEVIVCNDNSTDETERVLDNLILDYPKLRVINGKCLPKGWVGKPHACHQLAQAANGDIWVFIDADTHLHPEGLNYLTESMLRLNVDVISAVPRQLYKSWAEQLILPLLYLTYTSWFPLFLIWRSTNPSFLAANGQLLAVKAKSYPSIGGFESIRNEVVDDMAFCKNAKQQGLRVGFVDGFYMAKCRMYNNAQEVWAGFSKNIYEGVGAKPLALFIAVLVNILTFLLPWLTLALSLSVSKLFIPSLLGIVSNLITRALLAQRFQQPWLTTLVLHPVGILAMIVIALNSWIWYAKGSIHWRGRAYPPKVQR